MKRLATLIALLLIWTFGFAQLTFDKEVPNISLKNLDGEMVNLQDYAKNGKITIISFWATWCTHCKKELTNIAEIYDDWVNDYGLELIAVSTDNSRNTAKVKPFVDGLGLEFDVLLDTNEELKRAMNVTQIPFTFLINKEGKIVYSHTGYAEGDEYVLEEEIQAISK
ncbi:TlpA family protein disulfide reductase [Candidatus Amoebophilus asiaticus]|nr:TlpA family protein disulfide reductase [Candidatus Amoebophilus asiaticus]